MAKVRVVVPDANVRRVLLGPGGSLNREVTRIGRLVSNQAKRNAPVDTGRLRADIDSVVTERGGVVTARVGTGVEYAAAVHEGYTRGRRSVRGRPFLTNAAREVGLVVRRGGRA